MEKAETYINIINQMWELPKGTYDKMKKNQDLIEKELENYLSDDIKWAIQKYYTHKSDKTFPKLCHIIAILEATGKRVNSFDPLPDIQKPSTNILAIQDAYIQVCKQLHLQGVFYSEYFDKCENIPYGNKMYVENGRLKNKQWLWDDAVDTLIRNFPQEYNKFKKLSIIEKYAFAYKYGCFNVKDNCIKEL